MHRLVSQQMTMTAAAVSTNSSCAYLLQYKFHNYRGYFTYGDILLVGSASHVRETVLAKNVSTHSVRFCSVTRVHTEQQYAL